MFFFKESYDRRSKLEKAGKAAVSGYAKKAITEYKKVLEMNPQDHVTRTKVAGLLASTGQAKDAWLNFSIAASGFLKAGFMDKAIGLYVQATKYLPFESEPWEYSANLQLEKGRKTDAFNTLFTGSRNFLKKRETLPKAERLLKKALSITPTDFAAAFDLSSVLARLNRTGEAAALLNDLCGREKGKNLKRARWAVFKLTPGLSSGWLFLKSAILA